MNSLKDVLKLITDNKAILHQELSELKSLDDWRVFLEEIKSLNDWNTILETEVWVNNPVATEALGEHFLSLSSSSSNYNSYPRFWNYYNSIHNPQQEQPEPGDETTTPRASPGLSDANVDTTTNGNGKRPTDAAEDLIPEEAFGQLRLVPWDESRQTPEGNK